MKVGILGGGQLAQLLAHSAYSLGLETLCFVENTDVPAARLSALYLGSFDDTEALKNFAKQCDVITLENENIASDVLALLSEYKPVLPKQEIIQRIQDRWHEKVLLQTLNIPTTRFVQVDSLYDLQAAIENIGLPAFLKTRRFGYDGKGQVLLKESHAAAKAWEAINQVPAILEACVAFEEEVSLIGARNAAGQTVCYPLIKNTHALGVLRVSENPFINPALQALAEQYMHVLFEALDYIGVLTIEFFVKNKQLLVNEIAPRVHNSGHLTIEGFNVSQFELHLRSVLNLPLPKLVLRANTKMINIIDDFPLLTKQNYQNAHIYNYGKLPRPGRKLGHITQFIYSGDTL